MRFFVNACFWNAPILSIWIKRLERVKGPSNYAIWKRLALDQLLFAPIFTGTIVFNLRLLEGNGIKSAYKRLCRDYTDIMTNFYKLWPVVQLINYSFVPLNYRVVFIQAVALLWNVYLSFATQISMVQTR
uniref:Mitochondrial inner membrane protein Mpv17 n=1 Tax=Panagrellus redivivus TaxID=6233 RepID=A0A7E4VSH1_PANRE